MSDTIKTPEELLGMWSELKVEFEELEYDLQKNLVKGNAAAGRRARARFRALKKGTALLAREMVRLDKSRKVQV